MPQHIAMCGLDCSKCAAFIATQEDDDGLRAKTAKDWNARHVKKGDNHPKIKPEDINCQGCLSDGPLYLKCRTCSIRQCGQEKGIINCRQCPDYKCNALLAFEQKMW